MPERFTGWFARRGDVSASPAAHARAKQLLGELQNQYRLTSIPLLTARAALPDGSEVHVQLAHGVASARFERGPAGPGAEPLDALVQGFVLRPRTDAAEDPFGPFAEVLLCNAGAAAAPNWLNLFYDTAQVPTPPIASRGRYRHNRHGQQVFEAGLVLGGNVDWRNLDESLVLSWYGSNNRYFTADFSESADITGKWVFCNGDVLVDLDDHPTLSTDAFAYEVIGACARGNTLVWAVKARTFPDAATELRFYHAPLRPKVDPALGWLDNAPPAPPLRHPRFAPIAGADMVEFHREPFDPDVATWTNLDHPFVFNQAGTEGRLLAWTVQVDDDLSRVVEYRLAFASFAAPVFDIVATHLLTATDERSNHALTVRLNAVVVPDTAPNAFWTQVLRRNAFQPVAFVPTQASYDGSMTPVAASAPCAVDYKRNAVVRLMRAPANWALSSSFTATMDASVSFAGGFHRDGNADASLSRTRTGTLESFTLPFDVDGAPLTLAAANTETGSVSASSVYHDDLDGGTGVANNTFDVTIDHDETRVTETIQFHYLDLRYDTVVWSRIRRQVVDDRHIVVAGVHTSDPGDGLESYTTDQVTTGNITTTRTGEIHAVANGVTVAQLTGIALTSTITGAGTVPRLVSVTDNDWGSQAWEALTIYTDGKVFAGGILAADADATTFAAATAGLAAYEASVVAGTNGPVDGTSSHPSIDHSSVETFDPSVENGPHDYYRFSGSPISGYAFTATLAPGSDAPRRYGSWQVLRGAYCLSMPWPAADLTPGYKNLANGAPLEPLTGERGADLFHPLWISTRFVYEHAQGIRH